MGARRRAATAADLVVEGITKEVVEALGAADVPHIVLKGPLLRARLFPEGDPHVSADVDVLIAPHAWSAAEVELAGLGYVPLLLDIIPGDRPNHARPYSRAPGEPSVDLHRTLLGADAPASVVWSVLEGETETTTLGNTTVRVLNHPAQLMHVALHASQNGPADSRTLRYLARCIELSEEQEAADALRTANAIGATDAFALGMSLVPAGHELNRVLGITPSRSVLSELRAASAPNTAHAVEWFATRMTYRDRAGFVLHKVFPPAAYMASSYPGAHSRGGLLLAYPARWLWLARELPPSLRAWRRARRSSRGTDTRD